MRCKEKNEKKRRMEADAEDQAFQQHSLENAWNNQKDEDASKFYIKEYLRKKL